MPIPNGIRTPDTYIDVNLNAQRTGLPANVHKVLFITPDNQPAEQTTPLNIYDKAGADAKFGANSIAGRMITAAVKVNRVVDVQCLGKLQTSQHISCAGATPSAILKNENYTLIWEKAPTVDVFVNNSLVASNVNSMFINQSWYSDTALQENALQLGYSVSGTSSNQEIFYNSSNSNITFSLVPKSDGFLDGKIYLAKDALKIDGSNPNPTAYKDSTTGTISFCLAAGMANS